MSLNRTHATFGFAWLLVVFVTAFDQYAISAFDANAIDYLLKPYDRARLRAQSAATALPAFGNGHRVRQLLVTDRGVTRAVRVEQVGWIDKLGQGFGRCHRRAAVQLSWIDSIVARDKGDCELVLRGGARVPCSRQYRADVIARL